MYMARRTIQSPGVEINEIDLSLRAADKIGTNIFITGFSPTGPNDEIVQVSSLTEFEQIYGIPTNPAERYFYHTVAQSFNSKANILVNRLPYGENLGDGFSNKYFATVYPVIPINKTVYDTAGVSGATFATVLSANINFYANNFTSQFSPASAGNEVIYFVGKPTFVTLSHEQYMGIVDDSALSWSDTPTPAGSFTVTSTGSIAEQVSGLNGAGIIILNTAKTAINQKLEGYYLALTDNTNLYTSTDYNDITRVMYTTNESTDVLQWGSLLETPSSRLNFTLSAAYNAEAIPSNISETQEGIPSFEINKNLFDDTFVIGLYKLRTSVFSPEVTKLDYTLEEGYAGSIDYYRQINSTTGGAPVSFYLPQKVTNNSVNLAVKINPNISGRFASGSLNADGTPKRTIRMLTNQLSAATYTGQYTNLQYAQIVGLSSGDVFDIMSGNAYTTVTGPITANPVAGNKWAAGHQFGNSALFPAAKYSSTITTNNKIGSIPDKLDRVFDRLANVDLFDIDIIPEGGLGTIYTTIRNTTVTDNNNEHNQYFDDRDSLTGINGLSATGIEITTQASNIRNYWNTIQSKFINFAQNTRKDFIYISDPIRQILITGENTKSINIPGNTFPLSILTPLKQIYSVINTNYAAAYSTYAQVYDKGVDGQVWIPFSGIAAAKYAQTDANFAPWYAPAGFTRGLLSNMVNDVALYPNQKQRDSLYDQVNINPIAFFPSEGFVIFGQKTLQSQPSAFDRINVRRLFLFLEKRTRETVKYFVFEPNTLFTRTNVINVLSPIFEDAKNNQGLYDYLIVCDERNNTPDVIDANELIVDIYLKPVRAAEYILVNFLATRTGQDFSEIIG